MLGRLFRCCSSCALFSNINLVLPAGVNAAGLRNAYCTLMKITHTLIQKFLEDQCTPAEAEAVARHLKKHPELMGMYLKSTWDAAAKESPMPADYAEEMRNAIITQIEKQIRISRLRWISAAASLLIVGTTVWFFSRETRSPAQTLAKTEKQTAALPVRWKTKANTTAKYSTIKLGDGSVVKLAPGAMIKYQELFGEQDHRDIYLEGEAEFDVTSTKTKPFAVHTKLFSTIALGTSFRISETASSSTVKLFHGKVMIRSVSDTLKGWKRDIILTPGSEMKYNLVEGAVTVNAFSSVQRPPSHQPMNNGFSVSEEGGMAFDNTPLPEVMKILTSRYHSPIFYNEAQLRGKFFSGEVLKGDSLSVLLDLIANMNGLQVARKDNGYIIELSK